MLSTTAESYSNEDLHLIKTYHQSYKFQLTNHKVSVKVTLQKSFRLQYSSLWLNVSPGIFQESKKNSFHETNLRGCLRNPYTLMSLTYATHRGSSDKNMF